MNKSFTPMISVIARWLILFVWLFWFVIYWNGGQRIASDIQKSSQTPKSRLDTVLMILIAILSPALIITGLLINLKRVQVQVQGIFVTLLGTLWTLHGVLGTFYCRHSLGRFWTAETSLQTNHKIVRRGPYRIVRHPIYISAIFMYLGTALVFPTWWNKLAAAMVALFYVLKAEIEDRFLAENLVGYQDYQRCVRHRLVPWVW